MKKVILFALLLLAGCASAPTLNTEPLAAVAKENSSAVVGCTTATGPWGRGGVVVVNAAQANQITGKVTVNTDCSVAIESTK